MKKGRKEEIERKEERKRKEKVRKPKPNKMQVLTALRREQAKIPISSER
jgi:hypothetical protein